MERERRRWAEYISRSLDPDEMVHEIDKSDGTSSMVLASGSGSARSWTTAPTSRSQVCTALTSLGVEPPRIDVFNYGLAAGRIVEKMPDA